MERAEDNGKKGPLPCPWIRQGCKVARLQGFLLFGFGLILFGFIELSFDFLLIFADM